jgi:hypothetical protein
VKKLAQLTAINGNFEKLNETESLPPEFDAQAAGGGGVQPLP